MILLGCAHALPAQRAPNPQESWSISHALWFAQIVCIAEPCPTIAGGIAQAQALKWLADDLGQDGKFRTYGDVTQPDGSQTYTPEPGNEVAFNTNFLQSNGDWSMNMGSQDLNLLIAAGLIFSELAH